MTYTVLLHPKAARSFRTVPVVEAGRIKSKLREMGENPRRHADRLTGSPYWKRRVGDYRIIFEINDDAFHVIILYIGHRKNVYDDISKLV